ncbi:hypothetical protein F8388_024097 [Cannabis sativa]|uniref:Uncharacterized protein n=1 Tax=Cannabis sativa TaxID=3483 RepID=A0A7J6FXM4_CANSA|nr:hypothetical protein F8388_024097 [Cannabis sativa]
MGAIQHGGPELVSELHHDILSDLLGRLRSGPRKDLGKFYPIVYGEDIASIGVAENSAGSCDFGTLNGTLARGKVVLCFQSRSQRSDFVAARTVLSVKGVGAIFAESLSKVVSSSWNLLIFELISQPGQNYTNIHRNNENPVVKFSLTRTTLGQEISPEVAFFSSRGPSSISPSVLKPDIAAPGVNILASWSPTASPLQLDASGRKLPLQFKIESGTSMSCPHVTAVVALLRSTYPNWSPAAIKSALVTTASLEHDYGQSIVAEGAPYKFADPFDYGGGHVNPNKAIYPSLIFDLVTSDYVHFLCTMGYTNTAINLVTRTVTNVGPVNSINIARVQTPFGVSVKVNPSVLVFNSSVKKLKLKEDTSLETCSGKMVGSHVVRIPLVVKTVISHIFSET